MRRISHLALLVSSLVSSTIVRAQAGAAEPAVAPAPSLEVRPFDGESFPSNGLLFVNVSEDDRRSTAIEATVTLSNGDVVDVDVEQRCGTGSNSGHCVTIGTLPALAVGASPTLTVTAAELDVIETSSYDVVAADDSLPGSTPVIVARLIRNLTPDAPEHYTVTLGLAAFPLDQAFIEIFEETADGPVLLSVERPRSRNGLPDQAPEASFTLDDATERNACFTVVLHDIADNQLALESVACHEISPAAADDTLDTRPFFDPGCGGCSGTSSTSTLAGLALLFVVARRRRAH